jgi:uncharacterized SAM-binding protein YcdF (DUF218 family)
MGVIVLCLTAGLALLRVSRRQRIARRLLACGGVLFLVFTLTPLAEVALTILERTYQPLDSSSTLADVDRVVVLAGFGRDRPGIPVTSLVLDETLCRLAEALRLYRLRPDRKVVVSGGVLSQGERPVSAIMADLLIALGVPRENVILEPRSTTTFENVVEVQKLLGDAPFLLVAPARDLPRAVGVARRLGMTPVPAPACIRTLQNYPPGMTSHEWFWTILDSFRYPSVDRLVELQWAHHEYVGYLWYRLLGRI